MPATVTFTLSNLNAGTQIKYSSANSRTPAEQLVNADSDGVVTLNLGNAENVVYLVTLPDGQFFHVPVQAISSSLDLGTIPVYQQGVPPGLEDITSLVSAIIAPSFQGTNFLGVQATSGKPSPVAFPNHSDWGFAIDNFPEPPAFYLAFNSSGTVYSVEMTSE